MYIKAYEEAQHQSFEFVSDQLSHEPYAIWTHLLPVIKFARRIITELDFVSDPLFSI